MKHFLMIVLIVIATIIPHFTEAQTTDEQAVATLYRSSVVIENARILIATFNADKSSGGGGFAYNWENCRVAAELF